MCMRSFELVSSEMSSQLAVKNAIIVESLPSFRSRVRFRNTGWEDIFYNVNIERGEFKDRLEPSVCGVGFGVMRGQTTNKFYKCWNNMLNRCYSNAAVVKYKTYKDCSVAPLWYDFREFSKWCVDTYPKTSGVKFELDKDIRFKNNKEYSPDACIWLPKKINQYINPSEGSTSITGVKGVSPQVRTGKGIIEGVYEVRCADGYGRRTYLGCVTNLEEGAIRYKTYKERQLKVLAEDYLNIGAIDKTTYDIICNYKINP